MPAWSLKNTRLDVIAGRLTLPILLSLCLPASHISAADSLSEPRQNPLLQSSTGNRLFGSEQLLPVEQAFPLTVSRELSGEVRLSWTVTEGYYLYQDKISLSLNGHALKAHDLPDAEITEDEFFGQTYIYRSAFSFTLPLPATGNLEVSYQGCAEDRYCYPPATTQVDIDKIPAL